MINEINLIILYQKDIYIFINQLEILFNIIKFYLLILRLFLNAILIKKTKLNK